MPGTPIQELILQAIATRLASVTLANSYQQDIGEIYRPKRAGDFRGLHLSAGVRFEDPQVDNRLESGSELIDWMMPVKIDLCVIPSDQSTDPIDTAINIFRADVEKALLTDRQFGGLALPDTQIGSPEAFVASDGAYEGVTVTLNAYYRTHENDPYTNGIS